jgi:positive regulator of sigma E activity
VNRAGLVAEQRCLTANGRVTRCRAGAVEVEIGAPVSCSACQGGCLWRSLRPPERLEIATALPLAAGEAVVVALPERLLVSSALLLHGLPLAALLLGAAAGFMAGGSDLGTAAGAVIGVAAAWLAASRLRGRLERTMLERVTVHRERAHAKAHTL